jgi:PAS domain S-box-containing protein
MKHKILIVDDKKVALIILETILKKLPDIEVFKANNGKEAYTLAQKNVFSLALIDIRMPDMSGIELANLLYNNDNTIQLPIIFLSAEYPDKSQLAQYDEAILVDFMLKPINKDLLQHKVKTLLRLDLRAKDLNRQVREKTTALNDALDNWHGTLDAISDYIAIIDTNHTIKTANLAMRKKFGEDIIGKKCYQIFHKDKHQSPLCPSFHMLDDKSPHHAVINEESANKEVYWDISVFPIKEKNGRISRYVHVVRDVTASKSIDKQLRHGEKMIAIGQLAGGIAHDFNNQLTAILGYATLLRNKVEDDPLLSKFVDVIITASKRSTDLTRQLLAFARKGAYKKEDNDIHILIREAIVLIDRTIDKKIKLKLELHAENSVIHCDATQMENAILNLILNARDAILEDGCITISSENVFLNSMHSKQAPHLAAGYYIKIVVEDTGIGMSKETMNRIFEPFFSTKAEKGTGLGLAAIYGTVVGHKGDIKVDSKEEKR